MVTDCRDEINRLSADLEQIPKLEADLVAAKDQRNQLEQFLLESNNMLQRVIESIDGIVLPVASDFEEPVQKVNWLAGYLNECQQAKIHMEQNLEKVKEETKILASELADAQRAMKSLEDALSAAENQISQLSEEKGEMEVAKRTVELDLQKAIDETTSQTSKFTEACATIKSLEDSLSLAENNISMITKEREEVQLSRASTEAELEKLREDITIQTSKLTESFRTVKALEDALSQAETNVSLLTEQNNRFHDDRSNLESELKKLTEEADSQTGKLTSALSTIKSLEDALSKASNDIAVLEDEKKISQQKISMLNSKLNTCMDELAGTSGSLESRSVELMHHVGDLQIIMKNESLLSMVRQHFEKQFESLKNIDLILNDITVHFVDTDLEALKSYYVMEVIIFIFSYFFGFAEGFWAISDQCF
jgi:chromosome segregation ATPase